MPGFEDDEDFERLLMACCEVILWGSRIACSIISYLKIKRNQWLCSESVKHEARHCQQRSAAMILLAKVNMDARMHTVVESRFPYLSCKYSRRLQAFQLCEPMEWRTLS